MKKHSVSAAQQKKLAQRLVHLPEDKKAVFRSTLEQEGIDPWQLPIVSYPETKEARPLSSAQQRFWFIDQMDSANPMYNLFFALRIIGDLNLQSFQKALNTIIERHEVLRTNIVNVNGEGRQRVRPFEEINIPVIDLPASEDENNTKLKQLIEEETNKAFNISEDACMLRASLLRRKKLNVGSNSSNDDGGDKDKEEIIGLFSIHHIAFDAFSVMTLINELQQYYRYHLKQAGEGEGKGNLAEPLSIQYADYAQWQREWMDSNAARQQMDYWQQQLEGAPAKLNLPTSYRRPETLTYAGATAGHRLPVPLTNAIAKLVESEGVTLYMVMLAAFNILLSRYSSQQDICVGTSIANRSRLETENLLGLFVNTLVMRNKVDTAQSFKQLLKNVSQVATEAYSHQDIPFDTLVDILNVERQKNSSPLFQVLFVMNNALDGVSFNLEGMDISIYPTAARYARFDLTLRITEGAILSDEQGLYCEFEYNKDLFSAEIVDSMLLHYQHLLEQIVAQPERELNELSLLPSADIAAYSKKYTTPVVSEKNDEQPLHQHIHQRIEYWAEHRADQVALVCSKQVCNKHIASEQSLTYAELNREANQLARHLCHQGLKPGQTVGILLDRSSDFIISILAILKAGGAYLPLDTQWPDNRISDIVNDSGLSLLLTESQFQQTVSVEHKDQTLLLDQLSSVLSEYSDKNPGLTIPEKSSAYLIYTSGSTGRPKGVVISHQQLLFYADSVVNRFGLAGLSFATVSSVATDLGNTSIYGALCSGGTLHLISNDCATDVDSLSAYFKQHPVDALKITPSHFQGLLAAAADTEIKKQLIPVSHLLLGGEPCPLSLAETVSELVPRCRVINHYGPTETTVGALAYEYDASTLDPQQLGRDVLPVGKALPGYQFYIVDQAQQLCPVGVPGELLIGGPAVSDGYHQQSELTEERFIVDPFITIGGEKNTRYYRSGDKVRLLANGEIEFIGRLDDQVKIRGYRIELGEVEALLQSTSGVAQAAVLTLENEQSQAQLVAYFSIDEQADIDEIKQAFSNKAPVYMVPNQWLVLDELPLTVNGKIDRQALQVLTDSTTQEQDQGRDPRNEIEVQLVELWAELLGKDKVTIDDNFFELGGDSILSLKLIARLKRIGLKTTPKQLFEAQTIAQLVETFDEAGSEKNESGEKPRKREQNATPQITKAPADVAIPLSFAQQRLWFLHQLEGPSSTYNIVGGLSIKGALNKDVLNRSFAQLVERHSALRSYFPSLSDIGDQAVQQFHDSATFSVHWQSLLDLKQSDQASVIEKTLTEFATQNFAIDSEWLFKVNVVQLAEQEYWLLLNIHHMVADGWSLQLLVDEFSHIYQGLERDQSVDLPALALEYSDYAYWQHHDGAEYYQKQKEYWLKQLAGAPSLLALPTDYPRPSRQQYSGDRILVSLENSNVASLQALAQKTDCTLYMVLLAAWQVLLSRYSGQQDICVGTPVANRHIAELQPLVGFFANTLVIRGDLSDDPSFEQFLKQIKSHSVDAQAHQDMPFEQIVDSLNVTRDQSYSPLFQVLFSWGVAQLNTLKPLALSEGELAFSGLGDAQDLLHTRSSKFDLELNLRESGGQVVGQLEFNRDLFKRSSIERLWQHFCQLLDGIAQNSQYSLTEIPLLIEEEREQQQQWNATSASYPALSIEQFFSKQAKEQPEKIAARFANESLSYQALDQESNQLAHLLQSQGIGPGDLVGICQRRSLRLLSSVLAVLKAGAAYVPLDPAYPAERIHYMIDDAGLSRVLADQSVIDSGLLAEHPSLAENCVMNIETVMDSLSPQLQSQLLSQSQKEASLNTAAGEDDLAYMIYTSGSTGRPKGVEITRKNLTNFICGMNDLLQPNENDRLLAVTSLSFDIATLELYLPLTIGAEVVIGDEALSMDGERLKQTIADGITLMQATPVSWKLLLASEWQQAERFTALCGGEAFPVELAQALLEQPITLWNVYGPTETTVWSSAYEVSAENNPPLSNTVPIGRPIANTQLYVLDRHLQSVPVGVAGELFIGGDGVAQGYRGRADLTADRFIETAQGRLYRTGDLARYRADGVLECLGRLDNQVKVRGYRIELGEIEQCLMQHADVKAVVVNPCDRLGEPVLVAYILTEAEEEQHAHLQSALRDFVGEHLPGYMVPSVVVMIDEIPLTPNGKVDRKALPHPDMSTQQREYVAPRTETEEALCDIWQSVLDIERVGIHDNFFELGGHSLLATQLIARCQERFSMKLPLAELFKAPTIAHIASLIEGASAEYATTINDESLDRIDDLLAEFED